MDYEENKKAVEQIKSETKEYFKEYEDEIYDRKRTIDEYIKYLKQLFISYCNVTMDFHTKDGVLVGRPISEPLDLQGPFDTIRVSEIIVDEKCLIQ